MRHHHDLHSFPTRRSSDLLKNVNQVSGHIHMPPNSHWPFFSALGIMLLLGGMIFGWYVGIAGLALMLIGLYSWALDRKSTRLNSSHMSISYAVFCLKKKKI